MHLWQLAQDSIPPNATQSVHAFSTTTLNDIMKSFSDVSVIRVAGGYLLMVRVPLVSVLRHPSISPLLPPNPLCSSSWPTPVSPCCGGTAPNPKGLWAWLGSCLWLSPSPLAWGFAHCWASPSMQPPPRYVLGEELGKVRWGLRGGRVPFQVVVSPSADTNCSVAGPPLPGPRHWGG